MNTAAWISLAATLIVGAVTLLLGRETVLLANGRPPVSSVVRGLVVRWPGKAIAVGFVVVFVVGLFAAHFVWDAPNG